MPSAKIEVPLKYIGGKPHYRGDIMSFTVAEWNALSANDKVGLQITDFSDLLQQMVVQEVATGGGGGGGTPTTVIAPANEITNSPNGFDYEDWHITWAGGSMSDFYGLQPESELIEAYPQGTDYSIGYLSIMIVPGHLSGADVGLHDSYDPWPPPGVMNWTDRGTPEAPDYGWEPEWGGDPGVQPAGDYTIIVQHSPTGESGQYKPHLLPGMDFAGDSVQTGGGGGGGVNISDAYKGPWAAGPYNKGDLVNRNGSLYVADTNATEEDDPAAAGVPVDIGGYGGRPDAESYTGSDTEHWTQFTVGPAGARVSEIEVWVALLNAPTVPVGAKVGIYSADRTQVISIVTLPGGPWSGDDSIRGQLPDIVDLAPDTTYSICAYGNRIGVNNGGPYVPDGVVTAIGESATTYYGVTTAWAVPFRLYGPADIDGPWRRLVKGLP